MIATPLVQSIPAFCRDIGCDVDTHLKSPAPVLWRRRSPRNGSIRGRLPGRSIVPRIFRAAGSGAPSSAYPLICLEFCATGMILILPCSRSFCPCFAPCFRPANLDPSSCWRTSLFGANSQSSNAPRPSRGSRARTVSSGLLSSIPNPPLIGSGQSGATGRRSAGAGEHRRTAPRQWLAPSLPPASGLKPNGFSGATALVHLLPPGWNCGNPAAREPRLGGRRKPVAQSESILRCASTRVFSQWAHRDGRFGQRLVSPLPVCLRSCLYCHANGM